MIIRRFEADGFRNLDALVLEPHPVLTFLVGANGAGKSSVLEAIQCLASGHGFRSRRYRDHLAHEADEYVLRAELVASGGDDAHGAAVEHRCGVRRGRDGTLEVRLDYAPVGSFAEVARTLPVKVLTPDSHLLVQGAPEERRRFLDWGCFHADGAFHPTWRRYRRALSQRNEALRAGAAESEVRSWDAALVADGEALQALREAYVDRLSRRVSVRARNIGFPFHVELELRSGWSKDRTLAGALERNLDLHRRMRTTTDGPHRAELQVRVDAKPARDVLSRGQQKLLVYLMHLAQLDDLSGIGRPGGASLPEGSSATPAEALVEVPTKVPVDATADAPLDAPLDAVAAPGPRPPPATVRVTGGIRPVVLCDDLGSELDAGAGLALLEALVATGSQVIVTGVTLPRLPGAAGQVAIDDAGTIFPAAGSIDPSPAFAVFEMSAGRIDGPDPEPTPPDA